MRGWPLTPQLHNALRPRRSPRPAPRAPRSAAPRPDRCPRPNGSCAPCRWPRWCQNPGSTPHWSLGPPEHPPPSAATACHTKARARHEFQWPGSAGSALLGPHAAAHRAQHSLWPSACCRTCPTRIHAVCCCRSYHCRSSAIHPRSVRSSWDSPHARPDHDPLPSARSKAACPDHCLRHKSQSRPDANSPIAPQQAIAPENPASCIGKTGYPAPDRQTPAPSDRPTSAPAQRAATRPVHPPEHPAGTRKPAP